jgi:hypothetical protein
MGGLNSGHRSTRLREATAKRFDVLERQAQAKAEGWQEGRKHTLAFPAPHTGAIITARVVLTFTDQCFGGRRMWWTCPECSRRVRILFGGRSHITQPYSIACAKCQRIAYASNLEGKERRWRRQLAKIERQLGGDPCRIELPKGNARRTFDRLAARHALYRGKIVAHAEERLRRKLQKRPMSADLTELSAMQRALSLPTMETSRG